MTVYKAIRNFIAVVISLAIIACAGIIGGIVYTVVENNQQSSYAVSKLGSSGDEVKSIQRKLSSLGYYNGSVDGIYGQATKTAVTSFQRNCGITADGICGSQTLLYLGLSGGTTSNNTGYSDSDVELLAKVISAEARGRKL